jgi:Cys-tRNA(Pro)/Cys-tRNA(Cys) deacylase
VHPKIAEQLKQHGVKYEIREHTAFGVPIKSPADFACALGYPIERITKSLLFRRSAIEEFVLAVCSANQRIDLAETAGMLNCGRLELATASQLFSATGYPPTGVSPLGLAGIRVIIDEDLLAYETILIGGGAIGIEVEIEPRVLVTCVRGMVRRIVRR